MRVSVFYCLVNCSAERSPPPSLSLSLLVSLSPSLFLSLSLFFLLSVHVFSPSRVVERRRDVAG